MTKAKVGDKVLVHYRAAFEDGKMYDSTDGRPPFEFTIGQRMTLPGLENAVVGMEEGETKNANIPPEEFYGPYVDDVIGVVNRAMLPPEIEPKVGLRLQTKVEEGKTSNVTITKIEGDNITLDGNHPLAGKSLVLRVKLLEIF